MNTRNISCIKVLLSILNSSIMAFCAHDHDHDVHRHLQPFDTNERIINSISNFPGTITFETSNVLTVNSITNEETKRL